MNSRKVGHSRGIETIERRVFVPLCFEVGSESVFVFVGDRGKGDQAKLTKSAANYEPCSLIPHLPIKFEEYIYN